MGAAAAPFLGREVSAQNHTLMEEEDCSNALRQETETSAAAVEECYARTNGEKALLPPLSFHSPILTVGMYRLNVVSRS